MGKILYEGLKKQKSLHIMTSELEMENIKENHSVPMQERGI